MNLTLPSVKVHVPELEPLTSTARDGRHRQDGPVLDASRPPSPARRLTRTLLRDIERQLPGSPSRGRKAGLVEGVVSMCLLVRYHV